MSSTTATTKASRPLEVPSRSSIDSDVEASGESSPLLPSDTRDNEPERQKAQRKRKIYISVATLVASALLATAVAFGIKAILGRQSGSSSSLFDTSFSLMHEL